MLCIQELKFRVFLCWGIHSFQKYCILSIENVGGKEGMILFYFMTLIIFYLWLYDVSHIGKGPLKIAIAATTWATLFT